MQLPVLVVLDEAYIEFADEPSRIKWVQQYDNLVVLRTFSKSAALAGIRVGYGSFPSGMIDYLWRAKQPYNVSVASEVAACAALGNMTYLQVSCRPGYWQNKYNTVLSCLLCIQWHGVQTVRVILHSACKASACDWEHMRAYVMFVG